MPTSATSSVLTLNEQRTQDPEKDGMDEAALDDDDVTLLRCLAQGMSASQIAANTGRSARQVQRRVRGLRDRLAATTNIHAVAIAVRRSII
jgi:DNA-binding NarL/FixJ family response regulator